MGTQTPSRCGPYHLLEHLGTGGMAEVFTAHWTSPSGERTVVVVKRLLPQGATDRAEAQALFLCEARLSMLLEHPNVVRVFDCSSDQGVPYLVMEHVEGASLGALYRRARERGLPGVPAPLAALVMVQALEGLHAAHTHVDASGQPLAVVHRDVSPDNILVGVDGRVKVADFGIARANVKGRAATAPGVFRGKLEYSAPEHIRGDAIDARADVYAAALTFRRVVTGQNPQAEAPLRIAVGVDPLPEPPEALVDRELAAVLRDATAFDSAARTKSALELAQRLEAWLRTHALPGREAALAQWLAWLGVSEAAVTPEFTRWLEGWQRRARLQDQPSTQRELAAFRPKHRARPLVVAAAVLALAGAVALWWFAR